MGEKNKKHYVLIKDFNTFIYDYTLHRERKPFCRYFLHLFITAEISKRQIKGTFRNNGKQRIIMPKKGE